MLVKFGVVSEPDVPLSPTQLPVATHLVELVELQVRDTAVLCATEALLTLFTLKSAVGPGGGGVASGMGVGIGAAQLAVSCTHFCPLGQLYESAVEGLQMFPVGTQRPAFSLQAVEGGGGGGGKGVPTHMFRLPTHTVPVCRCPEQPAYCSVSTVPVH